MEGTQTTSKSRLTLWLIWLIALLPMLGAGIAYQFQLPVTSGQVNRGELLVPVQTLSQWGGSAELFTGHWTLVFRHDGDCDVACDQQLQSLRSVHDALGRDADRVRVEHLQSTTLLESGIWVVDPNGNLVLRYTQEQLGEPLLEDLKRLLKVSKLG
ncbi:hypothetical protein GCM10011352_42310 [Marinobacterium zhoushanense]|uniref:Transmembrane protein n=1 Tax=Marinobacterium zhoushanense TaxID=1679163 RepID=A0ABQ1KXW8_9GAMM|nr:hypothetical protein [Marinobacterium zhoushanense]GGC11363.1 hypothetical protein GCM10011352_42310 [Marinobacterium zhoushanense]